MTKEELAASLDGREYGDEMTRAEEKAAKDNNLVVLFGASDDLVELRGAIYDEVGAYDGVTLYIDKTGRLLPSISDEDEEVLERYNVLDAARIAILGAIHVDAVWGEGVYSWAFITVAPHASFDIMEDEEKYCRGIIIDLKEA